MAPRTAKAKKPADVKVAEEAPKKGKGRGKNTEEVEQEVPEIDLDEKPVAVTEKKTKRGKKAQETNGDALSNGANGITEDAAPPAKRGRKKKETEEQVPEEKLANDNHSADEDKPLEEGQNGDHAESNGTEEAQPAVTGKGRKKASKKEEKPKESGRGRKKQVSPEVEEEEAFEEKIEEKTKGKGRGRKPKAETAPEVEEEDKTEPAVEAKTEPATKGRKKAPAKAAKEQTPEADKESADESEKSEPLEEKSEEVKKETKGKKGKKAATKEEKPESEEKEPSSKKRKITKKEEKGKGDAKDKEDSEDVQDVESQEAKPTKAKRGKKAAEAPAPAVGDVEEEPDSAVKRRRKPTEEKAEPDSKKKAAPKNKALTNYEELSFDNNSKSPQGKAWNFKISCWNVDGIRAWMSKGGLEYLKNEKPDILCLQETKCAQDKLPQEVTNLPGYHAYWLCSDKDGYAGVGIYTTQLAMNVQYGLNNKKFDDEGRIITAEYEQFYLINTYVPNAGRKLVTLPKRLEWNEEFRKHVKELDKKKPVIICGDMNVAHNEIDLANPKSNRRNAGFTEEERAGMTDLLGDGFVDTYRQLYPDKTGAYTFWTYMSNSRAKNVGWRLDYFIVSERLLPSVCDNVIRDQVFGSDHCPISLFLHLTSAVKPKEE